MGCIPWAIPPFPTHLGAYVLMVTSFRRKPEQRFLPPCPALPASLPHQPAGVGKPQAQASIFPSHHPYPFAVLQELILHLPGWLCSFPAVSTQFR